MIVHDIKVLTTILLVLSAVTAKGAASPNSAVLEKFGSLLKNSPFGKYTPPPPKEVPKPVEPPKPKEEKPKPKPEPKLEMEFRGVISFNNENGGGNDVFSFYSKKDKRSFVINTGVSNESDPFSITSYDSVKKIVRVRTKSGQEQDIEMLKQGKPVVANGNSDDNLYGGYDNYGYGSYGGYDSYGYGGGGYDSYGYGGGGGYDSYGYGGGYADYDSYGYSSYGNYGGDSYGGYW
ncbi:MAG: hypothetical protein LBH49_00655 [Puniceicoccales bacterium]|jgi:hypothetical protein|nr:hypothetical protein [Puniceicoccales bacterium]